MSRLLGFEQVSFCSRGWDAASARPPKEVSCQGETCPAYPMATNPGGKLIWWGLDKPCHTACWSGMLADGELTRCSPGEPHLSSGLGKLQGGKLTQQGLDKPHCLAQQGRMKGEGNPLSGA